MRAALLGHQLRARKGMPQIEGTNAHGQDGKASSSLTDNINSIAARVCALTTLLVVGIWVHFYLGGVAAGPKVAADGGNSTDQLFNWHPVLMILAFAVFMTEAVLAYKAPLQQSFSRPLRKQVHWIMHSLALLCASLGVLVAWKSHTLKDPPIANLYSPHSYIGGIAMLLLLGQYSIGFTSYLWPKISLESRVALGPQHRFQGLAVYITGMAAAAVGLQEKATFLQAFGQKGVYSGFIRLPALTELLLVATVILVLYHYPIPAGSRRQQVQYTAVASHGDEESAIAAQRQLDG
eukprot:GHRR01003815.1.p1 GENE.GHRR01003815.1~~GHRR01003815.1.p1  ORF type:complete len:293 (+),score=68.89 GHRR01003815.1:1580-2458(+)